ncbi:MAG: hypothetical protein Q8N05_14770 [Bacteroidota bacterium]|nr:hypothetical protein [Bacteroidota bacterium]
MMVERNTLILGILQSLDALRGFNMYWIAGGLSLLLFLIFYLIIDMWQFKEWVFLLMVIGMNPLTIYMADRIINFNSASGFFFGGLIGLFPDSWAPFLNGIAISSIG